MNVLPNDYRILDKQNVRDGHKLFRGVFHFISLNSIVFLRRDFGRRFLTDPKGPLLISFAISIAVSVIAQNPFGMIFKGLFLLFYCRHLVPVVWRFFRESSRVTSDSGESYLNFLAPGRPYLVRIVFEPVATAIVGSVAFFVDPILGAWLLVVSLVLFFKENVNLIEYKKFIEKFGDQKEEGEQKGNIIAGVAGGGSGGILLGLPGGSGASTIPGASGQNRGRIARVRTGTQGYQGGPLLPIASVSTPIPVPVIPSGSKTILSFSGDRKMERMAKILQLSLPICENDVRAAVKKLSRANDPDRVTSAAAKSMMNDALREVFEARDYLLAALS